MRNAFASPRAAVVAATLLLVSCQVELQHDLTEEDANDIYVLLQRKGIDAKKLKEEGGNEPRYIISVAKQDVAEAATHLKDYALPRPRAEGLATFRKNKGMIPTATEERAMFIEALAGEISNALNRVPGVLEARAIVMIPEVSDLTQPEKKPQPSASVFLKYRPTLEGKPPLTEGEIQAFVANAVPDLKKEAVRVMFTQANMPEADGSDQTSFVSLLNIKVAKASAGAFKLLVALFAAALLTVVIALVAVALRRPKSNGRTSSRTRNPAAGE